MEMFSVITYLLHLFSVIHLMYVDNTQFNSNVVPPGGCQYYNGSQNT